MKKVLILIFVGLTACTAKKTDEKPLDKAAYETEINAWHRRRVEELVSDKGWLNLAGLFWLTEGINTFGAGPSNNIIFPPKIAERAGFFLLKENTVILETDPTAEIRIDNVPVKRMMVFHPDSARSKVMEHGSLVWFIIKRDDKVGIRLRDLKSEGVEHFKGIERYPVNADWRFNATFEDSDSAKTINITNVLGQTTPQPSPGTVVFSIDEKEYRLDAIDEGSEEYMIIFGDPTNARETYGAGRYLYINRPDSLGKVIVDFNKAYNPPCAFTAFATCPLPPEQNVLSVAITAGEKNYSDH